MGGIESYVAGILEDIRAHGLEALRRYSQEFDGFGGPFRVPEDEVEGSGQLLPQGVRESIERVVERVTEHHRLQVRGNELYVKDGSLYGILRRPIRRIGIYVPGGKPLPSSLIMAAVPARVAGVEEIAVCTPPKSGRVAAEILYVAKVLGIREVYRIGGVQAIAAMAFGVGMERVDKIFGPGNRYVNEAKRQVFGQVGIDGLAGPSEVFVVSDGSQPPELVLADLESQLEHGPDSKAWLCTTSAREAMSLNGGRIEVMLAGSVEECIDRANEIAPEHLEILCAEPLRYLERVKNAGAVYMGPFTPVPAGDYFLGVNHVLPTGGTVRFGSALTVEDFVRRISFAHVSRGDFQSGVGSGITLARAEGMEGHARSLEARL
ncbi:histidinol dehydrogenase [Thermogymnomonas acidicola]|uniref:Histidinol dehydrogenase n=1 Tax=Thermogymnomonas acidicola TaxID=399579 RepID=A0AA37BS00_9ARCH|nr:histidinol dehydrogenase [Thermogymnomonas acidicola]GGM75883.1 histidinol dehydrogenase [Thermogymnomonas acidicola]